MESKRIRNTFLEEAQKADQEKGSRSWVAEQLLETISVGADGTKVTQSDVNSATKTYIQLMGFQADTAQDYERMSMPDLRSATKKRLVPILKALGAKTVEKRKAYDET